MWRCECDDFQCIEQARGGTMTFGNVWGVGGGGVCGVTNKQILEAKPAIFFTFSSEPLLEIPRFHCISLAWVGLEGPGTRNS